jgi:hypothetical protein
LDRASAHPRLLVRSCRWLEGQCNPRDLAAGLDRLVVPEMQQAKQPF